jgi:hypothetical protein
MVALFKIATLHNSDFVNRMKPTKLTQSKNRIKILTIFCLKRIKGKQSI